MFNKLLLTALMLVMSCGPAAAQGNVYGEGDTGDQGIFHDSDFTRQQSQGNPWADFTDTQGDGSAREGASPLNLPGTALGGWHDGGQASGAATSVPILGTFAAPNNFALRQIGRRTLPPTRLDSFVRKAQSVGLGDLIYGDEGVWGPPPFNSFTEIHRIERGIEATNPGLTTGHPSDAPDAWGWPH